jgi:hypothetical protein
MAKVKINPIFGFELECAYNAKKIGVIDVDSYHSSRGNKTYSNSFYSERDGSLQTEGNYTGVAELISVPFQYHQFDKIIGHLKDHTLERFNQTQGSNNKVLSSLFSDPKEVELKEIFNFNKSCGCHIHVTPLIASNDKHYVSFKGNRFLFKGKPIKIKHLVTIGFLKYSFPN